MKCFDLIFEKGPIVEYGSIFVSPHIREWVPKNENSPIKIDFGESATFLLPKLRYSQSDIVQ